MKKVCIYCGKQLENNNVCPFCGHKNTNSGDGLTTSVTAWIVLSIIGIMLSIYTVFVFKKDLPVITPLAFCLPAYTIPKLVGAIFKGWTPYVCQIIAVFAQIFLYFHIIEWQHKYYYGNMGLLFFILCLYTFHLFIFIDFIIVILKFIDFLKKKK